MEEGGWTKVGVIVAIVTAAITFAAWRFPKNDPAVTPPTVRSEPFHKILPDSLPTPKVRPFAVTPQTTPQKIPSYPIEAGAPLALKTEGATVAVQFPKLLDRIAATLTVTPMGGKPVVKPLRSGESLVFPGAQGAFRLSVANIDFETRRVWVTVAPSDAAPLK